MVYSSHLAEYVEDTINLTTYNTYIPQRDLIIFTTIRASGCILFKSMTIRIARPRYTLRLPIFSYRIIFPAASTMLIFIIPHVENQAA